MDDINLSCLTEAKNEYSARLVNILLPHFAEGIQSIFQEAWQLCHQNDELNRYLITFQNFLVRIPKWNQTIIDEESERIEQKSKCNYLEDLITCVHITQLKILTSIRVGTKQKKIELDVPRLAEFIHKVYIAIARKLYKNVYLFERGIPALERQRHQREFELIIQEAILNTIRDSIPTDRILRAYMDQTSEIEEEVEERVVERSGENKDEIKKSVNIDASTTRDASGVDISGAASGVDTDLSQNKKSSSETPEFKNTIHIEKQPQPQSQPQSQSQPESQSQASKHFDVSNTNTNTNADPKEQILLDINTEPNVDVETNKNTKVEPGTSNSVSSFDSSSKNKPTDTGEPPKEQTLQFNDTDQVLNMDTNRREEVEAPKTIDHLEELGRQREAERNDDDDEETLKILDDVEDVKLDVEDLKEEPEIELDIQEMPTL
jgi:hypothetical protein